jgi:hypothetical protein
MNGKIPISLETTVAMRTTFVHLFTSAPTAANRRQQPQPTAANRSSNRSNRRQVKNFTEIIFYFSFIFLINKFE